MAKDVILVVDDEPDILELIEFNLLRHGFHPVCVATGELALKAVAAQRPALILLDLMLPGIDGLDVCRTLKSDARTHEIPIVMVSAKGEEADVVAGLELGADDYVVKPFSPRVLIARVKTALRRVSGIEEEEGSTLRLNGIAVHTGRREVAVDGASVTLTRTEFDLLVMLMKRPGRVFTRGRSSTRCAARTTPSPSARSTCRSSACGANSGAAASSSKRSVASGTDCAT